MSLSLFYLAWALFLFPTAGALINLFAGHKLDKKVIGGIATGAVAASFAFMLPVATPPNAIVFSTRLVGITQMATTGFWLNLTGVVVITGFVYLVLPLAWGITL